MSYWYGGDIAGYVVTAGAGNTVVFTAGSVITAWNSFTGGTQYTLTDTNGTDVASVTAGTGSGGTLAGALPRFQGPVPAMWLSADGGTRTLVVTTDVGDIAVAAQVAAAQLAANLQAHASARNPHQTRLVDLVGVAVSDATTGQVLALNADGSWRPLTIPGVTGVAKLADDNTFTGTVTISPLTTTAAGLSLLAAAGQTGIRFPVYVPGSLTQTASYLTAGGDERRAPSATTAVGRRITALSGQTANLEEWADSGDVTRAWVDASGRVRAPNIGPTLVFSVPGSVAVTTGAHRIYNDTGTTLTIRAIRASVGTAPTGSSLIVDVNLNGATVFASSGDRPTIAASANTSGKVTTIGTTNFTDGSYLTVDVDQVGSTVAGSNLVVQILAY